MTTLLLSDLTQPKLDGLLVFFQPLDIVLDSFQGLLARPGA